MEQQRPSDDLLAATRLLLNGEGKLSLAKIRHSLRTPINHIIGYAEILQEEAVEKLPVGFVADLEKIRSGGNMLLALVNQQFSEGRFCAERDLRALRHKLRTPVNHIIGYGEMLAEQCDEAGHPEFKSDLAKIVSAAHVWLALMEEQVGSQQDLFSAKPISNPNSSEPPSNLRQFRANLLSENEKRRTPTCEHLLLADDDKANRDLLRRRLEKMGYRITACGDGREALKLASEATPDLVLLDMLMPIIDGREALALIKADPTLRHLPVIMISAFDQMEGVADCIELGAEDYLAKPFDPVLLRARIGAALDRKRLRDAEQIHLRQIEEERTRSDRLLLNILPRPIADRLKSGEEHIVNSFDEVTVMFADLVGFTALSTQIPPTKLVRLLDQIFSVFDEIADRHGLEKIKTIGDNYMAAAGLPFPHHDHASAAAHMALDMHEAIEKFRPSQSVLKLRIGICTGPVIAGVIGQNKFIYDLWGDTVNTASRMESHGVPGRTQVAETTYELLRDRFRFEERGAIEVKGKGSMKTYFLCST
jgi:class 3 adenylate cyclase